MAADTIIMVAPGEQHRIIAIDPVVGARWVIIKQHSQPKSKHRVEAQS